MVITHRIEFLAEALDSVLRQTVAPSQMVCVDNASPDEHEVRAAVVSRGFDLVRIGRPVRSASARNIGCEVLSGCDLIVNLDGDDILEPSYVEHYSAVARSTGADVVFGAATLFGEQTGIEFTASLRGRRADLRRGNYVPMNSLFRHDLWRRAGGFDPSIGLYDDYDFWLSCQAQGATFAAVEEPLWRYRRHRASQMTSEVLEDKQRSRHLIRLKHARHINGWFQWRRARRKLGKVSASILDLSPRRVADEAGAALPR